ncbi:MAG TPA: hypothetical protein PLI45_05100 [Candidatus Woesebacteria bacterium]|nr:hypothetical protein [Candidatus Woesebacteria bacterium]
MDTSVVCVTETSSFEETRKGLISKISDTWKEAKEVATAFVQMHNLRGHKGQKLFDMVLKSEYDKVNAKIKHMPYDPVALKTLLDEVSTLVVTVQNYHWVGHFCLACGEPINSDENNCERCRLKIEMKAERDRRYDFTIPSTQPTSRPKKTGSAARRGHGHAVNESVRPRDRKKGKGGRTAK